MKVFKDKNNILMLQADGKGTHLTGALDIQIQNRGLRRITYQGKHVSLEKCCQIWLRDVILSWRGWDVVDETAGLNSDSGFPVFDFSAPTTINMHFLNGKIVGNGGATRTHLATLKTKQHRIEKALGIRDTFIPPEGHIKLGKDWVTK